jgi:hypothetical protein
MRVVFFMASILNLFYLRDRRIGAHASTAPLGYF